MNMDVDFKSLVVPSVAKKDELITRDCKFSVKQVDLENRTIRVLASNADLDRDEEVILPDAFKARLGTYQGNPVVLTSHQHQLDEGEPSVVGRSLNVWIDAAGLWAVIQFARTELAEKWWQLYSQGFMKAVSVGFMPIKWHDENVNGLTVRTYDEVELLEISLVAVGSNRAALAKSKQRKADFVNAKKEEREFANMIAEMVASGEISKEVADDVIGDGESTFVNELLFGESGRTNKNNQASKNCNSRDYDFEALVNGNEKGSNVESNDLDFADMVK